jgi:hypothetical protein
MHRRHLLILLQSGLLCILGWGCSSRPQLTKADIEAKIKDSIPLKEIHLTEAEPGKYEGTGTGRDGRTWKIKASYTVVNPLTLLCTLSVRRSGLLHLFFPANPLDLLMKRKWHIQGGVLQSCSVGTRRQQLRYKQT